MRYQAKETHNLDQIMEHNMADTDRTAEVTDMVNNIIAGNSAEAQKQFSDQMTARTHEALDDQKAGVAADIYNKHVVDPEMEPQGVALDDALVDIDQTTGRPVEGETNGEDI